MNTNESALRGTPAQLAGRLAVNGKPLGQAEISFLTRMGFAQQDGTAKTRSGRGGKPATIWIFNPSNKFTIEAIEKARGRKRSAKAPAVAPVAAAASVGSQQGTAPVTQADLSNLAQMIVRGVAEAVSGKPAASAEEPANGNGNKAKAA